LKLQHFAWFFGALPRYGRFTELCFDRMIWRSDIFSAGGCACAQLDVTRCDPASAIGNPRPDAHRPRGEGWQAMRQTGVVKFFNQTKGYGFIKPDDGGTDVFVHVSAVERSEVGALAEGMRISFDTEPDKRGKGPKAIDLKIAT
jgi:CspA family cold shock protein